MDEEKSTTPAADNQEEVQTPTDQQGTDQQTQTPTGKDNLDETSKSDTPTDDDKSKEGADDTPAPKTFDKDLDEWAEKTGRAKPESDRERELYQEIRDSQREFSRSKQAKDSQKEVDKAIQDAKPTDDKPDEDEDDDRDPVEKRQDAIEQQLADERALRARSEYFTEKSVTEEESKVMGEILKEKVDKGGQKAFDYWTDPANLEDWHTLAKARLATNQDTSVIEEEAARKERARIAKEHQAGGPSRNATVTTPAKPQGYNRTEYLKSDD